MRNYGKQNSSKFYETKARTLYTRFDKYSNYVAIDPISR